MVSMFGRPSFRLTALLAAFGLALSLLPLHAQDTQKRGRKYKAPPATARIEVTILRDANGKPVENAAVIFHPMEGERDKGNMELKTNEDGKTIIDVLPIGDTVRLQVIAKGFQTYGQDFKVDKAELAIEIKLKRPGEQYSIYKPHPEAANSDKTPGEDKPAPTPAKDAPQDNQDKPTPPPSQPQSNL